MRKHIVNEKIRGTLRFVDGPEFENVNGEISYDVYSNKGMQGEIFIDSSAALLRSDPFSSNQIVFRSAGMELFGNWKSVPFLVISGNVAFSIDSLSQRQIINSDIPCRMEVRFLIPYIAPLARDLKSSFGFYEEYIVKFNSEELKFRVNDTEVIMREYANLVAYEQPDSILNRILRPVVSMKFTNEDDLIHRVHEAKMTVDDLMLIISLLLHKRFNTFGFEADLFNDRGKLIERHTYRCSQKSSGEDYTKLNYGTFRDHFSSSNISKLVNAFYCLDKESKAKFQRIVNAYLTIGELNVFEPMFRDAYFALEAVSKLILGESNEGTEARIVKACERLKIDIENYLFEPSTKKCKKLKWLISEYRNELTHYNFDPDVSEADLSDEFHKMMKLLRMLLIGYLDAGLMNFPAPN